MSDPVDALITERVLSAVDQASGSRLDLAQDRAVAKAVLAAIPISDMLDFVAVNYIPRGYRIIRDTDPSAPSPQELSECMDALVLAFAEYRRDISAEMRCARAQIDGQAFITDIHSRIRELERKIGQAEPASFADATAARVGEMLSAQDSRLRDIERKFEGGV